jgi:hypothetical protein
MRLAILACAASLCAACSSTNDTTPGSASSPFSGTWACTVNETLTFTQPPGTATQTTASSQNLAITASGDGTIVGTTVTDGGVSCKLKYTTSGSTATLENGQTCAPQNLSLTYQSGTATVNGSTMTANVAYAFSGSINPGDAGAVSVAGSGTSAYNCTKQ